MAKDTQHFKVSEFTCKCGCGFNNIDQRVINMAETIRKALGVPVHVNSGCRCEKHNALFYIGNEGISIIENADRLGIPIPGFIRDRFLNMKKLNKKKVSA